MAVTLLSLFSSYLHTRSRIGGERRAAAQSSGAAVASLAGARLRTIARGSVEICRCGAQLMAAVARAAQAGGGGGGPQ